MKTTYNVVTFSYVPTSYENKYFSMMYMYYLLTVIGWVIAKIIVSIVSNDRPHTRQIQSRWEVNILYTHFFSTLCTVSPWSLENSRAVNPLRIHQGQSEATKVMTCFYLDSILTILIFLWVRVDVKVHLSAASRRSAKVTKNRTELWLYWWVWMWVKQEWEKE